MLEQETRELLLSARDRAAASGVRATFVLHREKSHLMRIGNNSVSLNTSEELTRLDAGSSTAGGRVRIPVSAI